MAIIVGLVAVAVVPAACITAVCDLSSDPTPSGTIPHDSMSHDDMPHALAPVFQAVCDMAAMAAGVVENAIPPSSPTLLISLVAALALAVVSLMPRLTLFRMPALAGDPPGPPVDLRGVRLLI